MFNNAFNNTLTQITKKEGLADIVGISVKGYHSVALQANGAVWSWGYNYAGQIGDGTNIEYINTPVQAIGLSGIGAVSAGYDHTLALSRTGITPDIQITPTAGMVGSIVNLQAQLHSNFGKAIQGKTLKFTLNGNRIGSGITDRYGLTGMRYLIPDTLSVGQSTITVSYDGDTQYDPVGKSVFLTAIIADTKILLNTLTAKAAKQFVIPTRLLTSSGSSISGRKITFLFDNSVIGSAITSSNGTAQLIYMLPQETASGPHTLTTTFAGDNSYKPIAYSTVLTVSRSNTSIQINNYTAAVDQRITFLCRVLNDSGHVAANRSVDFSVNGSKIGAAVTDSLGFGRLLYTVSNTLGVTTATITVNFSGDTVYNGSSGVGALTIKKFDSRIFVWNRSGTANLTVTITARLWDVFGMPILDRTVNLSVNSQTVGTSVTQTNGFCTFRYKIPPRTAPGTQAMTVSFSGDSSYITSTCSGTITIN